MTISVAMAAWDRPQGERLRDILGSHRGDCPVTLELVRPGAFAVAVAPSALYRVRPDTVLKNEVEALLGPGALRLSRTARWPGATPRKREERVADTDFEAPLVALQKRIDELAAFPGRPAEGRTRPAGSARSSTRSAARSSRSSRPGRRPWSRAMPNRPYTLDYVQALFTDWTEVHGDRRYGDDPALVCGFALYKGRPVAIVGHQKGRDTKQKIYRNFGMPKPEGYRKALRVMRLAEKFGRPIVCFVDTPGAYPGLDAEERGQAEAIAFNLREMAGLRTPILVFVTGEGGSGGALAIAVGDRVNMLEHSVYSVITPEGCASILWRDAGRAEEAATAMKITAPDLVALGIVDEIVPEPAGGAHAEPRGPLPEPRRDARAPARRASEARRARPWWKRATRSSATWAASGTSSSPGREHPLRRHRGRGDDGAGRRHRLRLGEPRRPPEGRLRRGVRGRPRGDRPEPSTGTSPSGGERSRRRGRSWLAFAGSSRWASSKPRTS